MIAMFVYDREQRELESLKQLSKETVAYLSEETLEMYSFSSPRAALDFAAQGETLDLACIRIRGKEEICLLRLLRKHFLQLDFLLVADRAVSPMEYLTPDIRAAALLLYPYQPGQQKQVWEIFLKDFLAKRNTDGAEEMFVVENQSGKIPIPVAQIYYIEVRERKIYIRLRNKEYVQYGALEHVMRKLPDTFLRCHRSFAFNTHHLDLVKLSENAIYLEHGIMVPLSRSYKASVKEYIHGLGRR